jgi:hypothetical protein
MLSTVEENPNCHFFFDEVPLGSEITAEDLQEVSENVSPENFLWLACQSQLHPASDDLRACGNSYFYYVFLSRKQKKNS